MKKEMTSAQANKLLKSLREERDALLIAEEKTCVFSAAMCEDIEELRPAYDYAGTQEKLRDLETKIRSLKHSLNLFNAETIVPETGMTIDQVLIYIPQLTERRKKLLSMKQRLPKERVRAGRYGRMSEIIDYEIVNYDLDAATRDCLAVSEELSAVQTALDTVNNTITFTVDI